MSIARNLSNTREINIFDDTLSALDSNTEKKIMNNLLKEVGDNTLIVISNKMSKLVIHGRTWSYINMGKLGCCW